jgi:hypothetical protein
MALGTIAAASTARESVEQALRRAQELKPDGELEPPITTTDIRSECEETKRKTAGKGQSALLETAIREQFYRFLVWPLLACLSTERASQIRC